MFFVSGWSKQQRLRPVRGLLARLQPPTNYAARVTILHRSNARESSIHEVATELAAITQHSSVRHKPPSKRPVGDSHVPGADDGERQHRRDRSPIQRGIRQPLPAQQQRGAAAPAYRHPRRYTGAATVHA